MVDKYIGGYRKAVKNAKDNKEIDAILNNLYDAGFEDGANEG